MEQNVANGSRVVLNILDKAFINGSELLDLFTGVSGTDCVLCERREFGEKWVPTKYYKKVYYTIRF